MDASSPENYQQGKLKWYASPLNVVLATLAILAICTLLGVKILSDNNRFYLSTDKNGQTQKIDRKTGDVWLLKEGRETKLHRVSEITDKLIGEQFQGKGAYDVITRTDGTTVELSRFEGTIYNGSDLTVTELEIEITNEKTRAKGNPKVEPWTRKLRCMANIRPKSHGTFQVETVDGEKHGASDWSIVRVWGYQADDDA